ncbi:MAG: phosphatase PAP2 family protein, partial [Clostridiales bacterium]|nr:phosphatase PAP2 family protein [Clostridiales bacterium]
MFALFQQLDGNVLLFLQEHLRCAPLSLFLIPLTIFGGCGTMWIILSVLLLLRPDTRKAGWMALLSLLLCYIFNDLILKELVQRSRPFWVI